VQDRWVHIQEYLPLDNLCTLKELRLLSILVGTPPSCWSTLTSITKLDIGFLGTGIPRVLMDMSGLREITTMGSLAPGQVLPLVRSLPHLSLFTMWEAKRWQWHFVEDTTATKFREEARELKMMYPRVKILLLEYLRKHGFLAGLFNQ